MVEPDVILGIKIKRENKGIVITQSHYIEKILKKFNRKDCSPVSTPMDLVEKLIPNIGKLVDQLEYSRAIGCLMYAMTSTRPGIAYAVEILLSTMWIGVSFLGRWWCSISRASKTANYASLVLLCESEFVSIDALPGIKNAISGASKKQTCIIGSTMESEFVALAIAGKEAE
ncbi:hypothetical protein Tco_0964976 [Tanacetum coccineum]